MQLSAVQTALWGTFQYASARLEDSDDSDVEEDCVAALIAANTLYLHARAMDRVNKQLSRAFYRRADLLPPSESPYAQVMKSLTDGGFLTAFRLDVSTFYRVVRAADPEDIARADGFVDARREVRMRGRPRNNNGEALLALALHYLQSMGGQKELEAFFGSGHSVTDRDLDAGLNLLLGALRNLPAETDVCWPTFDEMTEYCHLIYNRYGPSPVAGVYPFCFIDGLRKNIHNPYDFDEQQKFYNGYTGCANTLQIFAFAPTGKIIFACTGMPGSWNDFTGAAPFYERMESITAPGFVAVADKGFSSHRTDKYMASERFQLPVGVPGATRLKFERWRQAIRKSAEFGLNTMCCTWRRINNLLPKVGSDRDRMWEVVIRLYNLNAHCIPHHNQIKTMYAP
jgi:hypothetical protein